MITIFDRNRVRVLAPVSCGVRVAGTCHDGPPRRAKRRFTAHNMNRIRYRTSPGFRPMTPIWVLADSKPELARLSGFKIDNFNAAQARYLKGDTK